MVKGMNTEGIEKATGRSFAWWAKVLDKAGAKDMPHTDIAKLVPTFSPTTGWWAQGITVAYEQHIGRRKPGQRADGTFSASVSMTVEGTPKQVLARWQEANALPRKFIVTKDATSKPGGRYLSWRATFKDGSSVVMGFDAKAGGKCLVAVEHQKLKSAQNLAPTKEIWRMALAKALQV